MNVLYLDFLYPKSHIRQNVAYISCLSKFATIYVLCPKGRYSSLPEGVILLENDALEIKKGRLLNRLSALKIMAISARVSRKIKPDFIFISTYETMIFTLGRLLFRRDDRIYLLQHYNVDELENGIKSWFFRSYMKKVEHVVFEEFIKNYLIEDFELNPEKVHVLPHQLNENLSIINKKKYTCVGLSASNDEQIIAEIIDIENKKQIFKKAGCKVILKSQVMEYDNGFLKVIKGYLDDDVYNEYINNSQSIYMPFPLSFKYRMSGTLVDALSNNKVVLASNIPLIKYYASKYPEVCNIVNNSEDFFNYVLSISNTTAADEASEKFEQFKAEHSETVIFKSLKKMFKLKSH